MGDWKSSVDKINELLKSKNLSAAAEEITTSLNKFPDQLNLLVLASDVYRASSNHEKSLEYAKLLVKHYPCQPNGYIRSAQDLIALGEKLEAQKIIQDGVKVIPKNLYLLIVSREVFRRSGNREKCLDYSKNLITYHPSDWRGYGRAAQDLVSLERFEEAQAIINMGLEKIPNHVDLLTIATDVYRASGDREKSLKYSELLITHHPDNWNGYGCAAQDLVALKRFKELKRFGRMVEDKPIKKDLGLVNDWFYIARAGEEAVRDIAGDCMHDKIREFSEGRNILIPIGDFCLGAQFVSDSGGRQHALPFDWLFIKPNQIQKIVESNFEDFIDLAYLQSQYPRRQCGHSIYRNTDFFNHHDPSREPDRSAFKRRIERFRNLVSDHHSDILFFNVRLAEKSDDLLGLLSVLPENSKILSFVFLGHGTHEKPVIKHPRKNILQIVFRCDNQNTYFAQKNSHPSRLTNGNYIYCPYSSIYAGSLLSHILSRSYS